MRKITATLLLSLFVAALCAQKGFVPREKAILKTTSVDKVQTKKTQEKAPGDVIWEHDFDGELWSGTSEDGSPIPTEAPVGWELTDATGEGFFWRWDTVGPRGSLLLPCPEPWEAINAETADNGFVMMESVWYNSTADCNVVDEPLNMDGAVAYTAGLDFSNTPSVHLYITQWSRFCCNAYNADNGAFFDVSTDGGNTWESIHVEANAGVSDYNANDGLQDKFDVSNLVGGQSDVQFRFRVSGLAWYYWLIDDIRFVEPLENDLVLDDYWNNYIEDYTIDGESSYTHVYGTKDFTEGFYYYPWFMTQDFISYDLAISNIGSEAQTNVVHKVDVMYYDGLLTSFTSDPYEELGANGSDTIKTMGTFEPGKQGRYSIVHTLSADVMDDDLEGDTLSRDFVITSNILSPVDYTNPNDDVSTSNYLNWVDGNGLAFKFNLPDPSEHGTGNNDYYLFNGVEVYLTDQGEDENAIQLIESGDATLTAELYRAEWDEVSETYSFSSVISSNPYVVQLSDTATVIEIPFVQDGSSEYVLEGGTYFMNIAMYGYWDDELLGREISLDLGSNSTQKYSYDAGVIISPGAPDEDPGPVDAACIAISMDYIIEDSYSDVTFNVVNQDNDAPLENAVVTIDGEIQNTDEEGVATFYMVPGSTYSFSVSAEFFEPYTAEVEVVEGEDNEVSVNLVPLSIFTINTVDFNIYPNPSNGVFNLDVDGNATVTVTNVAGQVVESMNISGSQAISLDNVNSGVYFVRVKVGEKVGTKQLIIR